MDGDWAKASEGDMETDLDPNTSQTWLLSTPRWTVQVVPFTSST